MRQTWPAIAGSEGGRGSGAKGCGWPLEGGKVKKKTFYYRNSRKK